VAQEVERVFPQAVVSAGGNGDKGVDPNAILALTVDTVQKQGRLIEQLQAKIRNNGWSSEGRLLAIQKNGVTVCYIDVRGVVHPANSACARFKKAQPK
jgi:hypothetical protein